MAKDKEQIISIMEKDIKLFQEKVDYYKKNQRKLLIPKYLNELVASVSIVSYITERVKQFKED